MMNSGIYGWDRDGGKLPDEILNRYFGVDPVVVRESGAPAAADRRT